jgi:hypothetical protein
VEHHGIPIPEDDLAPLQPLHPDELASLIASGNEVSDHRAVVAEPADIL